MARRDRAAFKRVVRKRIDTAVQELAKHQAIADAMGTDDLALAQKVALLGFSGVSAKVFDLLPLVHVAWADGRIQKGEREAILGVLRMRGLGPDHEGWQLLESLLEERPTQAYVDASLQILGEVVGTANSDGALTVVQQCEQVADAAGGLFGLGQRISAEERELIQRVASALGQPRPNA